MAKKMTKGAAATSDTQDKTEETTTTIQADAPVATEAPTKKPRKKKADAIEPEPVAPAADPAPAAKKTKRAKSDATLRDVFNGYVESLEEEGKTGGTIASYKSELVLAGDELGLDTRIVDLTPERVVLFFGCDRVQRKRNGRGKSPLSIAKTQRVVRQALQWAETKKLVARAPLPEEAASH